MLYMGSIDIPAAVDNVRRDAMVMAMNVEGVPVQKACWVMSQDDADRAGTGGTLPKSPTKEQWDTPWKQDTYTVHNDTWQYTTPPLE